MSELDDIKFRTCQNCPDRSVEPNCHMTCEGYLFRCEKLKKAKEGREDTIEYYDFKKHSIAKTRKRIGQIK